MRNVGDELQTVAQIKKSVDSTGSVAEGLNEYTSGLLETADVTNLENFAAESNVDGVSAVAGKVVEYSKDVFSNLVETAGVVKDALGNIVDKAGDAIGDIFGSSNDMINEITEKMGFGDSGLGVFANAVEKAGGQTTESTLITNAFGSIKEPEVQEALATALADNDTTTAIQIMKDAGYTASDVEELKDLLSLISNTAGGTVVLDESDLGQAALPLIQSDFVQDKKFTYVSSVEELESEMRRAASERDISECIIHHSDSFTNTNWSAEDIDEMNTTFGYSEIIYHYVIKRDGSIQRGRDIRKIGEHCPLLNHNAYSIGLVIVGGMNVPSSSELFEDVATASGITLSQFQSLWEFLRVFYNNFPGGQVLGHQDIDVTQEDPGFNVIEYCRAEFGKESIYCDPTKEEAMSVDEIIRHQRVTNINDHFTSITKDDF